MVEKFIAVGDGTVERIETTEMRETLSLSEIDLQIAGVDDQIEPLQQRRDALVTLRAKVAAALK